jgi:hypothetical protein
MFLKIFPSACTFEQIRGYRHVVLLLLCCQQLWANFAYTHLLPKFLDKIAWYGSKEIPSFSAIFVIVFDLFSPSHIFLLSLYHFYSMKDVQNACHFLWVSLIFKAVQPLKSLYTTMASF